MKIIETHTPPSVRENALMLENSALREELKVALEGGDAFREYCMDKALDAVRGTMCATRAAGLAKSIETYLRGKKA